MSDALVRALTMAMIAAPVVAFLVIGGRMASRPRVSERAVTRAASLASVVMLVAAVLLVAVMLQRREAELVLYEGAWFTMLDYAFRLVLRLDSVSAPMLILTVVLTGLVGRYAATYVHRERGHARFYLLLMIFTLGCMLIFTAGTMEILFAGWELLGLSSTLLIAFFQRRVVPLENGLYAFAAYRIADSCLLTAVVLFHHFSHTSEFEQAFLHGTWLEPTGAVPESGLTLLALLVLLAAAGKAAQLPFTGWLPRAMEGPTPSSAIFYGGLSVHAGAYLLLRTEPLIAASPTVRACTIALGAATAVHATLIGRVQADAKSQLAYATATQLGLVFVEVGLGWTTVALVHVVGHACLRTYQYLRAPSLLQDFAALHAAGGGEFAQRGRHLEALIPHGLRRWVYGYALMRGGIDSLLRALVFDPLQHVAAAIDAGERRIAGIFGFERVDRGGVRQSREEPGDEA